ncbi:hypothetical protein KEM56_002449, partial [Ascosphaera pollenicola]
MEAEQRSWSFHSLDWVQNWGPRKTGQRQAAAAGAQQMRSSYVKQAEAEADLAQQTTVEVEEEEEVQMGMVTVQVDDGDSSGDEGEDGKADE